MSSDESSVTFTSPQFWSLLPEVYYTFTADQWFYPLSPLLSNPLSSLPPSPNTLPTSNKFTSSIHFPAASCRASSFSPSFLPSPCLLTTNSFCPLPGILFNPSHCFFFSLLPSTERIWAKCLIGCNKWVMLLLYDCTDAWLIFFQPETLFSWQIFHSCADGRPASTSRFTSDTLWGSGRVMRPLYSQSLFKLLEPLSLFKSPCLKGL